MIEERLDKQLSALACYLGVEFYFDSDAEIKVRKKRKFAK